MKVRIKTYTQVKEILGEDSFLEFPEGASLNELLEILRQKAGESEDKLFSTDGSLLGHLVLMVNGARIYEDDLGDIILSEGDEISLFSPVSGG